MPDWKAETRTQLGDVVRELEAIQYRLLGIAASLRAPRDETARLLGGEEPEDLAETRSVIECVLVDRLSPAIRDLVAAVEGVAEGRR
jgi:hypothetical protein